MGVEHQRGGEKAKGFAAMSPERHRELASKGGWVAHDKGTAHEWTGKEARKAKKEAERMLSLAPAQREEERAAKREAKKARERQRRFAKAAKSKKR